MKYKLNIGYKLNKNIEKMSEMFEKLEIEDIQYILGNKKQMIMKNFFAGVFRGFGIGVGITIVTGIVIIMLQKLVVLNIPVIGEYIADIIDIIEQK